jgi:hypothetical protein
VLTEQALTGRVRIAGRPQVELGDLVKLQGLPDVAGVAGIDGTYQVRGVRHRLSKAGGFVTDISWRSTAGAAGAAGGTGAAGGVG